MVRHLKVKPVQRICLPPKSVRTNCVGSFWNGYSLNNALQIWFTLLQLGNLTTVDAGYQNAQILIFCLQHLLHFGYCSNAVEIHQLRIVHQNILLGYQKQSLILLHCGFQSTDRLRPAQVKVYSLIRKNRQPTKSYNRHFSSINGFSQGNFPPFLRKKGVAYLPPSKISVCQRVFLWGVRYHARW